MTQERTSTPKQTQTAALDPSRDKALACAHAAIDKKAEKRQDFRSLGNLGIHGLLCDL